MLADPWDTGHRRFEGGNRMSILTPEVLRYVGVSSDEKFACEPVERGAVRRFAQAVMDPDPAYWTDEASARFGGPVAPPLYPVMAFRKDFGEADELQANANNPDFDGAGSGAIPGLPEIDAFRGFGVLNGGSEIEVYRYARIGERIKMRSRYDSITERETRKGPMIFIRIVSDYLTEADELLVQVVRTTIRRPV